MAHGVPRQASFVAPLPRPDSAEHSWGWMAASSSWEFCAILGRACCTSFSRVFWPQSCPGERLRIARCFLQWQTFMYFMHVIPTPSDLAVKLSRTCQYYLRWCQCPGWRRNLKDDQKASVNWRIKPRNLLFFDAPPPFPSFQLASPRWDSLPHWSAPLGAAFSNPALACTHSFLPWCTVIAGRLGWGS